MTAAFKPFTLILLIATTLVVVGVQAMPNGSSRVATGALIRDNGWTSGGDVGGAVTQVLTSSASQNSPSFKTEGTGFEPATDCSASDFESDR
jgi:hypothetical protein